ncbi:atherin-like [Megalops cyprinoides]|uniref:atherin-like n=1 Tax=Megalops cyprinoides TaxID=118141 RepID=UPI0018643C24|nr:atherin-like [Megalops cyprinoides]
MGRLDDAAKRKVVELRKAGLSFRKIKAVLELENIKVSAQAIYLFLKEFQGKSRPEEGGSGGGGGGGGCAPVSADASDGAGRPVGWPEQQVWSLMRDVSRSSGYAPLLDSAQQGGTPRGGAAGRPPGGTDGAGRSEQLGGRKEEGIRIVSVTSLARGAQHGGPQMAGAVPGPGIRRKVPMSPASSSIMVARKRLLDKALLHKARMREMAAQSGQQAGPLYGRGQACFQGNDARKVTVLPPSPNLGLTSPRPPQARRGLEGQPVSCLPRRTLQQRVSLPARSLHPALQRDPPSCTAIRISNPAPAPPAGQGTTAIARAQHPPNPSPRKDPSPSPNPNPNPSGGPPRTPPEAGWRGGLQEQMQTLGAELRGLGLAVRLLTEQQSRLEREQAQQTQIQRQILSTLQALAASLQQAKTPPPPGPSPFGQDGHGPARAAYAQCSQPPCAKYCELDESGLESLEAYKLPGLSPPRMNGFQGCGAADALPLGSAQAHTPSYTDSPAPSFTHSYSPAYTQSHAPAYSQGHARPYAEPHSGGAGDYPVTAAGDPLPGCSPSANIPPVNPDSPLPLSPHNPQLNIIKVEAL